MEGEIGKAGQVLQFVARRDAGELLCLTCEAGTRCRVEQREKVIEGKKGKRRALKELEREGEERKEEEKNGKRSKKREGRMGNEGDARIGRGSGKNVREMSERE